MKKAILCIGFCLLGFLGFAQNANINNFLIKENLLKNKKLAIIAADSLNMPNENINGNYTFSVSGFTQNLKFNDGIAVLQLPIEKSTFIYIKHQNDTGTHSKLVYVYKKDNDLNPIAINSLWLFLIPVILVIVAFAFRKMIIVAVIVFLVFVYFNHSSGLNLSTFFESIFDGLKNLV
ncbi:hypothetical protein EZJ43_06765 [Pedobacter changchengzhani]|uniref:Uncharacterized protein n=1 Tax=Pedobacter changchengzhani TaxID=2529274 RepID=A0A4R5MN56_9SPHI|nr:hypothetical protein [Pedobacter changchengzhani]TDG36976.1 hypothetical protein EZJ43_06765 [Pedobacter changchengzhani]